MIKSASESRRVKLTKRLLKNALMELVETEPLSSISVTKLCKQADVNRSTFYSYYNDIIELLKEIEDDILAEIPMIQDGAQQINLNKQIMKDFTLFFEYVRKHDRDFKLLLQTNNMDFRRRLMETVMQHFQQPKLKTSDSLPYRFGYVFAMNGVIGVMMEWILSGFPMDDSVIAKLVLQMSFRANDF